MTALVLAEHDNASIKGATLNAVTAASKAAGDVHVLVVGHNAAGAAQAAAKIGGVSKVLAADGPQFADGLAEAVAAQVLAVAGNYSHVFAAADAYGKNVMPRVAATLDAAQISDIISVESADTFTRPIYAGNAIATVQSGDKVKVVTVRTTGPVGRLTPRGDWTLVEALTDLVGTGRTVRVGVVGSHTVVGEVESVGQLLTVRTPHGTAHVALDAVASVAG